MIDLTPVETRAQDADFVAECSMTGLQDHLPLVWPAPPDVPPSPKNAYHSHYTYPGWEALEGPEAWEYLSDFELVLYLIDFEPLRPVLAQRLGWTSAKGQKPFDPVSLQLLNQIIAQSVMLLVESGFLSQEAWAQSRVAYATMGRGLRLPRRHAPSRRFAQALLFGL